MMPDNELATVGLIADFLTPTRTDDLVDYEWGGIELNDPSQGLFAKLWTSKYIDNKIIIYTNEVEREILTVSNVTAISFAFDFNMSPLITYVANDIAYLYFYDSVTSEFITVEYDDTYKTPQISLDDHRPSQSSNADVILAYVKGGLLTTRLQRDRFETEYIYGDSAELLQIGMMTNNRFGFLPKETGGTSIAQDTIIVNSRNRGGRFDYFDLLPLQSSYSLNYGDNVAQSEGLAGNLYRNGFERAKNEVSLGFNLGKDDYDYFMSFYRLWQYKRRPFIVDLVLDERALSSYKAHFAVGSISASYLGNGYHRVTASMIVLDNALDKASIKQIAESRNV